MILLIDNYDSFTYNIYQYVREFTSNVCVKKNDECTIDHILKTKYSHIIISPGPGSPSDAGISSEIIKNDEYKNREVRCLYDIINQLKEMFSFFNTTGYDIKLNDLL